MKKIFIVLISFLLLFSSFSLISCGKATNNSGDLENSSEITSGDKEDPSDAVKPVDITVKKIEISKEHLDINVGEEALLSVKVTMSDGIVIGAVEWTSSDKSIAIIDGGRVKAIKPGTVEIKATSKHDSSFFKCCSVTVKDIETNSNVRNVALNFDNMEIMRGMCDELKATVVMDDYTTNNNVEWQISNENVVTFSNGKLKAINLGETVITAVSVEDKNKTASCCVNVIPYTAKKEFKILFMGDSISDGGRGRSNWESYNNKMGQTYTRFVSAQLTKAFPDKNLKFCSRGIGGQNISQMLARADSDIIDLKPDVVNILAGVNNSPCASSLKATDPIEFENTYRAMLDKIKTGLPDAKIIICETFLGNVGSEKPFYNKAMEYIREFQQIERKLAEEYGALFIPINDMFEKAYIPEDETYWLWDGVHPSVSGHGLLAKHWMMNAVDYIFENKGGAQ